MMGHWIRAATMGKKGRVWDKAIKGVEVTGLRDFLDVSSSSLDKV